MSLNYNIRESFCTKGPRNRIKRRSHRNPKDRFSDNNTSNFQNISMEGLRSIEKEALDYLKRTEHIHEAIQHIAFEGISRGYSPSSVEIQQRQADYMHSIENKEHKMLMAQAASNIAQPSSISNGSFGLNPGFIGSCICI